MKLLIIFCVCVFWIGGRSEMLSVPENVLSFIMGCGKMGKSSTPFVIDSETGSTSQTVSMVDVAHLRQTLEETIGNQEVIGQILSQVEDSIQSRQGCTEVKINVPPQEVKGLSEQLQAVVQQNNYQLLEQVNTLLSFKLNSFYKEVDELLTTKLAEYSSNSASSNCPEVTEQIVPEVPPPDVEPTVGETRIFSEIPVEVLPILKNEEELISAKEDELLKEDSKGVPLFKPKSKPEPEPEPEPEPKLEPEPEPASEPEPAAVSAPEADQVLPEEALIQANEEEETYVETTKSKTPSPRRRIRPNSRLRTSGPVIKVETIAAAPAEEDPELPPVKEEHEEGDGGNNSRRIRLQKMQDRRRKHFERFKSEKE